MRQLLHKCRLRFNLTRSRFSPGIGTIEATTAPWPLWLRKWLGTPELKAAFERGFEEILYRGDPQWPLYVGIWSFAKRVGCANMGHSPAAVLDPSLSAFVGPVGSSRACSNEPDIWAHQERAGRAADRGLRRLGASELSEAGECLGNERAALFERRPERRGQHVATIGFLD